MQVTDVIDADYKFYNTQTGELRSEINSTKMYPIKTIVFKEEDEIVIDDFIKWDTYPFLCTANFLDESVLIRREW